MVFPPLTESDVGNVKNGLVTPFTLLLLDDSVQILNKGTSCSEDLLKGVGSTVLTLFKKGS